jgi:thiol-disulfide isomerase/thioredoxin
MVGSKKKEAVAPERTVAWTTIDTHQDAPDALQEAARAAKGAPVVYVGATWCGPCKAYKASLSDPKMKQAHVPVQILELDADKHPNTLQWAGITPNGVPHWEMVDSGGKSIGKTIDGSAWEANTVDNMAPALSKFFTGG